MILRLLSSCLLLCSLGACVNMAKPPPVRDPLETINRGIFWFNDQADIYVLEPIAKGYDWAVPKPAQDSVGNFFDNLRFPVHLVSDLIQLRFSDAGELTARFLVNTTLGGAGLFDPASDMGLKGTEDDIGIALGAQGVAEGPYLVLPFWGPSNVRDLFGKIANLALDPLYFMNHIGESTDAKAYTFLGLEALDIVDTRAGWLEAIKTAKESSLDYYLFSQGAYHQYRQGLIYDGNVPDEDEIFEEEEKK